MKAVICTRYGPPEVLQLREVEKPEPKNDEVRVKIAATAVTASDCIVRGFKLPRWQPIGIMMGFVIGFRRPRRPILGMVLSGVVESVGQNVQRFKPGDQIYGMTGVKFGTYAEHVCLSEKECLVEKPDSVSHQEAAAVTYGGLLASHFLRKGAIESRQRVLVYGASGANGTTAVQLAKHYGAEVTGVCSTKNIDLVKSLGADAVLDYTKEDILDREETYDLVFDAVGKSKGSKLKSRCKEVLSADGTYLSVDDGTPKSKAEYLERLNELMEAGHFKAVIDRTYSLDEIVEAHRYVDTGRKRGNVVIVVEPALVG